ncbi:WD40 repeat-like protein [Sphaerulina musiva SO2202]|uniref:WD40 repeat-like protein n=1 Tax=Sphaerulina musiva (strain SO2202) TaxID=692275 RepID=N1QKV8_SPHMS|nr:WD40 repeat-like protein [Sphaerulina musiva SO2202]EMF16927.1 WD40 repeat-like protein [Sphaerulina musiva SO2202]
MPKSPRPLLHLLREACGSTTSSLAEPARVVEEPARDDTLPASRLEPLPRPPPSTHEPLRANAPPRLHHWGQGCRCRVCRKKPPNLPHDWVLVAWKKKVVYYHDHGANYPSYRQAKCVGAVWTVGGAVVTEGVASVTNGRGGRLTSGSNAPHFTSDFLDRHTPSEDEAIHGDRLALAMDVTPPASMFEDSSPATDSARPRTRWNNGAWETDGLGCSPTKPTKRKPKEIPIIPFRVLDAPALRDDYYCSLLAYSHTMHCLAVGLGPHVYLWSEVKGTTPAHIPDSLTVPFGAHVTSLSFSSIEGGSSILAIGRADGRVTLWSPQDNDPRFDSEQPAPVSCVCFRPNAVRRQSVKEPGLTVFTEELLVGDEMGNVYYYSVEWPTPDKRDLFGWHGSMTLIARFTCHSQQVCGLAWSKRGEYFGTGGNDNQLYLFESKKLFPRYSGSSAASPASDVTVINGSRLSQGDALAGQGDVLAVGPGQEKHVFSLNAAVKAICFAPWQNSLVAAGGGSNDRCIHFFHAVSGARLATIDCHAQVTSLVWSSTRKEVAATFGFAQPEHPFRVAVFAWPSCERVVGIPWWGEERALYAVGYPGGADGNKSSQNGTKGKKGEGCLVVATSDASIKFHEVWGERSGHGNGGKDLLGGSSILEDGIGEAVEGLGMIR